MRRLPTPPSLCTGETTAGTLEPFMKTLGEGAWNHLRLGNLNHSHLRDLRIVYGRETFEPSTPTRPSRRYGWIASSMQSTYSLQNTLLVRPLAPRHTRLVHLFVSSRMHCWIVSSIQSTYSLQDGARHVRHTLASSMESTWTQNGVGTATDALPSRSQCAILI